MNHVVFADPRPPAPTSAVPVLPATRMPGICAAVPVPPCDDRLHHPREVTGGVCGHRALVLPRPRAGDDAARRRDDSVDSVRFHDYALVANRRRDHRHLFRRRQHPLLAEREPARVDLSRRVVRVVEPAVLVEAAGRALVAGRLERRVLVEAELLRRAEDAARADRLADLAEDRIDRVLERLQEVHRAEALGPALVAEVLHLLAVLDAVALVEEARVDRVLARVERCGARDHLEGRSRRVQAVGGPVQQRRGRPAGGADVVDPPEVAFDQVRVVGRPRGHHEQLPVARVERDHRAALACELLHRHALRARLDRQPDVVALDRRAADLVERRFEHGAEVRVRAGQVVVQRRLEPRARARLGRVADQV